jgi:hypothetical protein
VENANPEFIVAVVVGVVTGIWGWLRSRKDASIVKATKDQLAKAILADIRRESIEQRSSQQIIDEFTARARDFTESSEINDALIKMSPADIMWNLEQIKVREGDATQW